MTCEGGQEIIRERKDGNGKIAEGEGRRRESMTKILGEVMEEER